MRGTTGGGAGSRKTVNEALAEKETSSSFLPFLPFLENLATARQNVIFPVQTVLRRPNLITLFGVYTWRTATLLISMKTFVPSEPGRSVF